MEALILRDNYTDLSTIRRRPFKVRADFKTNEKERELTGLELHFKPITMDSMEEIKPFLDLYKSRTTDFSFGGILMWVDYFHYEYDIFEDTLFIKGRMEDEVEKIAFSHPIGKMKLADSKNLLEAYCRLHNEPLEFSAVPEIYVEDYKNLNPVSVKELEDWADYIYDANDLATLKGKRFSKKRNHVNQFENLYPGWSLNPITPENVDKCLEFMKKFELEGDDTFMAKEERALTCELLEKMRRANSDMFGAILDNGEDMCAFTIGDIVGDTLFIHVEKALREFPGSYEMINKAFAEYMLEKHPEISFINREDDAGDEGLRKAKESYRPVDKLRKYNIIF